MLAAVEGRGLAGASAERHPPISADITPLPGDADGNCSLEHDVRSHAPLGSF
jgi:hypothetical protein